MGDVLDMRAALLARKWQTGEQKEAVALLIDTVEHLTIISRAASKLAAIAEIPFENRVPAYALTQFTISALSISKSIFEELYARPSIEQTTLQKIAIVREMLKNIQELFDALEKRLQSTTQGDT